MLMKHGPIEATHGESAVNRLLRSSVLMKHGPIEAGEAFDGPRSRNQVFRADEARPH